MPQTQVVALAANYDMVIANALGEYVLGSERGAPYLQAIKSRYPEKIVLDQFLVAGKDPLSPRPPVYAGHWLLLNGTMLTSDLLPSDNVIQVADSGVLREGEDVQITTLDAAGRPDYTKVEQVQVVTLAPGRITVERGAYGSAPLEFKAGRARIAAHAYHQYSGNFKVWLYNFSLEAPQDLEGRRLIEALAQELAGYLRPGGPLAGLDGYQFDDASFLTASTNQGNRRFDSNNDGAPDGGFGNGVNYFGLGTLAFMRTLRGLVGEDTLLLSEATGWWSNRDIADANGIENESFPDLHKWELFSSAYQRYQYWLEKARPPRLSYLQLKETTEAFTRSPEEDRGTNWKYRLALAAALMGNGYFAYWPINPEMGRPAFIDPVIRAAYAELDEFKAGLENRWNYLGKALEEPRRLDMLGATKNLLTNGNFDSDLSGVKLATVGRSLANMTSDQSQAAQGRASLRVSISRLDPDPGDNKVRVEIGTFTVQAGKEYTLRLRVRADLKYDSVDPIFAGIPRRVVFALSVPGLPASSWVQQDVMADLQWREYWLAFVAPADSSNASIVVLLGREGGDVWLDDLRLQQGPGDVFARRFEHGAVLVNASTEPIVFDLRTLFPGMTFRRISGTQDPAVNSGQLVGPTVTVPGRDALILLSVEGR